MAHWLVIRNGRETLSLAKHKSWGRERALWTQETEASLLMSLINRDLPKREGLNSGMIA